MILQIQKRQLKVIGLVILFLMSTIYSNQQLQRQQHSVFFCNAFVQKNRQPAFLASSTTIIDRSKQSNQLKHIISSSRLTAATSLFTTNTASNNNNNDRVVRIAVTREDGKNEKLQKAINEQLGGSNIIEVIELPCIEHADGPDYDQLQTTIQSYPWDYITITSPEAARVLQSAWPYAATGSPNDNAQQHIPIVVAVGVATEKELQKAGIPVGFVPSTATAKVLVQELPHIAGSNLDGICKVLYPASARAERTLQDGLEQYRNDRKLFQVTRLNTYDTITATWTSEQTHTANNIDIVTFASPSSIKGWLYNTKNCTTVKAACIGETSANACTKYGWDPSNIFYPTKPGIDGWVQSIADAIQSIILQQQDESTTKANTDPIRQ